MRPAVPPPPGASARGIAIVGGGPVGLLLSILLAERGYSVSVFEARPDPRADSLPGGRPINHTRAVRGWPARRLAGG